ncbi:MAG: hypothetical protein OHK93_001962 [Ramalina farinacea]|uniref:Uncharacterized protein n=1 Tax=Ramalina farinacea TaxID=258253 RepID=A0AA43TWQ9_9LECA|nr:hypothetical protein [Ramalina farinacea]
MFVSRHLLDWRSARDKGLVEGLHIRCCQALGEMEHLCSDMGNSEVCTKVVDDGMKYRRFVEARLVENIVKADVLEMSESYRTHGTQDDLVEMQPSGWMDTEG